MSSRLLSAIFATWRISASQLVEAIQQIEAQLFDLAFQRIDRLEDRAVGSLPIVSIHRRQKPTGPSFGSQSFALGPHRFCLDRYISQDRRYSRI
jgi:hypothetical protein